MIGRPAPLSRGSLKYDRMTIFLTCEYAKYVYSICDFSSPTEVIATEMERVLAIGGVLFRARDPVALGRWYQEHLGGHTNAVKP